MQKKNGDPQDKPTCFCAFLKFRENDRNFSLIFVNLPSVYIISV